MNSEGEFFVYEFLRIILGIYEIFDKIEKTWVLKESTKNTDGFQQKIKSESAIRTARLQKNNEKR